jgi:hypothetical protein
MQFSYMYVHFNREYILVLGMLNILASLYASVYIIMDC